MSTKAGGQAWRTECCSEQVDGGEERSVVWVEAGNEERVPEGVHAGTAGVEKFAEICVDVGGEERALVFGQIALFDATSWSVLQFVCPLVAVLQ